MMEPERISQLFIEKAGNVSIVAKEIATMQEAITYAIELCKSKEVFQNLLPENTSDSDSEPEQKIIAAPGLAKNDFDLLTEQAAKEGISVIQENLRKCMAGLDVSLSIATMGIADTATTVLDCSDEEIRLASMVCEDHVLVLPKSQLKATSTEAKEAIQDLQKDAPRFISFISGASRTADIERVLALGVHGPLELHVLLLDA